MADFLLFREWLLFSLFRGRLTFGTPLPLYKVFWEREHFFSKKGSYNFPLHVLALVLGVGKVIFSSADEEVKKIVGIKGYEGIEVMVLAREGGVCGYKE